MNGKNKIICRVGGQLIAAVAGLCDIRPVACNKQGTGCVVASACSYQIDKLLIYLVQKRICVVLRESVKAYLVGAL